MSPAEPAQVPGPRRRGPGRPRKPPGEPWSLGELRRLAASGRAIPMAIATEHPSPATWLVAAADAIARQNVPDMLVCRAELRRLGWALDPLPALPEPTA